MNIFDVDTPYASPNKAINDDGVITTASGYSVYKVPLKANTTYTFQKNNTATAYIRIVLMNSNDIKESLVVSGNMSTIGIYTKTFTTTSATAYAYIQRKITDENVKLVEGTNVGGYSPYNMGCITEKIVNGNYLKNSVESQTINGITITKNADDSMTINGTTTASFTVVLNPASNLVYLKAGTYRFCLLGRVQSANNLEVYDINNTRIAVIQGSTAYQSTLVTFEEDVVVGRIITYINTGKTFNNVILYPMITKGSTEPTVDDYVPHQEQTFIIPCQQPMEDLSYKNSRDVFVKENGIWYERHKTVRIKTDGTEEISIYSSNSSRTIFEVSTNVSFYLIIDSFGAGAFLKSTHFKPIIQSATWSNGQISTRISVPGKLYMTLGPGITVEEFKTWLSNNNVETLVVLVTPINLPCTSEQTQVLEAYIKARTYKNVTHFYSEDETPAYQEVVYVKDLETVINQISNAITALGGV